MDGWEFMRNLTQENAENLKIFIVSSSVDPRDHILYEENPHILGFIEKPITAQKLTEVITAIKA